MASRPESQHMRGIPCLPVRSVARAARSLTGPAMRAIFRAVSDLKASLLRIMDHKDHWAWPIFGGPTASLDQLKAHFQQEYAVYVRDFPILVSRVHSRCPIADVRRDLAENLYEEETGGLSGTGPHPELFLYM